MTRPIFAIAFLCSVPLGAQQVLLEAESFSELGGWSIDQQYMDQMGSPFLLAHGLGVPVADARTEVQLPGAGRYRIWVRTRDWVAHWKVPGAPGKFQLLVDGAPLNVTFGTEGEAWHWQDGGVARIAGKKASLALHDLTGFDGRCDAVLLSRDLNWTPPDGAALDAFRRKQLPADGRAEDAGSFDLVVVGGGMAGITSAVAAARLGSKVALIQDRPVLGGNSSSEIRVFPGGSVMLSLNPGLGAIEHELDPGGLGGNAKDAAYYADEKKFYVVAEEKNIHLFLNQHALRVEKAGNRIIAVVARDVRTGRDLRFTGAVFADCTGDATIGALAGAEFHVGREGQDETGEALAPEKSDTLVMGTTFMWYAEEAEKPVPFAETPWALEFNERTAQRVTKGDWDWELGMHQDQIQDGEAIRDYAYRALYGNWSFLKNHLENRAAYAQQRLSWVAYVAGKRESRRLIGDVILREQDIIQNIPYPDGSAVATWGIDLHYPSPTNSAQFPDGAFRSIYKSEKHPPYAIPYRCFYSRNIDNLFMAGRNVSVTHVALGTVRVQRTTAMMGEVVGMAASLCRKYQTTPRGVYRAHLDELKALMQQGVGKEEGVREVMQLPAGFSRSPDGASWKPGLQSKVMVRVWFHTVPDAQGDRGATLKVIHDGALAVRRYDMTDGGDQWLDLGTFAFGGGGLDCVRLVRAAGGRALLAGDVKFEVLRPDGMTVRTTVILKAEGQAK
jgi:hypothetical protein